MITVCLTYFRSLTLDNLRAALHSVQEQSFEKVDSIVIVDNNTADNGRDIFRVIGEFDFPVPVRLRSFKHGDPTLTHSWSTNVAVREAVTPWVLCTRADYILDYKLLQKLSHVMDGGGFITSDGYHLTMDIEECDRLFAWRSHGPHIFQGCPGQRIDYTLIDSGVFLLRRSDFDRVDGLDEKLSAWGHAQTDFQYRLYKAGVVFERIPEILFYHPRHGAVRDIDLAHRQLVEQGIDIKELWARHTGEQPYK